MGSELKDILTEIKKIDSISLKVNLIKIETRVQNFNDIQRFAIFILDLSHTYFKFGMLILQSQH